MKKKKMETGTFTSAPNASAGMALVPLTSVYATLPERFPWLSAFSSGPARSPATLGDEFALFAEEASEWAELTLAAGLEGWPDDLSDQ